MVFWLVIWNLTFVTFHSVGNVIIPTDELIFFRRVALPRTRRTILVIKMIIDGYNMIFLKARLDCSTIPKHLMFYRRI